MRGTRWELECGRRIAALFVEGSLGDRPDALLVERFARDRSEHAFAALVDRHGPRVLRVCRAVAGDPHAAEDAFQATFLVLARKAGRLRVGDSLGPWLHGVAIRVASTARTVEVRRQRRERIAAGMRPIAAEDRAVDPDLHRLLHLEIGRLPVPLREAVTLCDVEGLSHAESARRLGWPLGTIKSRQARGRAKLRSRLIRRGVDPAASLSVGIGAARAAVPEALRTAAIRGAISTASGGSFVGAVPAAAHLLSEGMMATMTTKTRLTIGGLCVGLGAIGVYAQSVPGTAPTAQPDGRQADPSRAASSAPAAPSVISANDPVPASPSDDEVWEVFQKSLRASSRITVEKVGEKTDPPQVYPLAGPCQLVHQHYKATVYLRPDPATGSARVEVVFLDKDYLRGVPIEAVAAADGRQADGRKPAEPSTRHALAQPSDPERPGAATRGLEVGLGEPLPPAPTLNPEQRLAEVEKKLDLILNALENSGKTPFRTHGGLGP